jgi:dephospho-CoA kinase
MMRKIAVTGGLSCGKSSVCQLFKELGAYVVSADEVVHRLLTPTTDVGKKVIALFGPEILVEGQIDRQKIAKRVFRQPPLLHSLEQLLHPAVREDIESQYQLVCNNPAFSLFVVEIPLLFETGAEIFYDATVAVVADPERCMQRFEQQGHSRDEYKQRMARQLDPKEKAVKADYLIINEGSLDEMKKAVIKIYEKLNPKDRSLNFNGS